jgi:hypothetical protein
MKLRDVKVDDVEFERTPGDLLEHQHMRRERVATGAVEA